MSYPSGALCAAMATADGHALGAAPIPRQSETTEAAHRPQLLRPTSVGGERRLVPVRAGPGLLEGGLVGEVAAESGAAPPRRCLAAASSVFGGLCGVPLAARPPAPRTAAAKATPRRWHPPPQTMPTLCVGMPPRPLNDNGPRVRGGRQSGEGGTVSAGHSSGAADGHRVDKCLQSSYFRRSIPYHLNAIRTASDWRIKASSRPIHMLMSSYAAVGISPAEVLRLIRSGTPGGTGAAGSSVASIGMGWPRRTTTCGRRHE